MKTLELSVSRQRHVRHLHEVHVLSLLSLFGAFFTAKIRDATVTTSRAKRRHAVTVDDIDMTDAEGDICDKGAFICQLN
jgi:hypothetical protein